MKKRSNLPDIVQAIDIDAKRGRLWNAITRPDELSKWFMLNDIKPVLGHTFTLHTDFGAIRCQITKIVPQTMLSFSWGDFGWQVTFEIEEHDGKTRFTVIHSGWGEPEMSMPNMPEKQAVIWNRMNGGWANLVNKLRSHIERDNK
jgi:uncharacterized protein YndB with AHSA1/START domain